MVDKTSHKEPRFPHLKLLTKVKKDIMASNLIESGCASGQEENALEFTAQAAAAYCLANDIKADHFNNMFRFYLVEFLKKSQPDCSNLQIAIRTGMDRRLVGKVKKYAKPTKEQIILSYLKDYCRRKNTDVIKKKGLFDSFEYYCKKGANGTMTSKVLAEELMRLGHIKDIGSRYRIIFDH